MRHEKYNAQDRIILMINAGRNIKLENNNKSDRCYNIYKLNYYTNYTH